MVLKLVNLNVWLGGKLMPQIIEFLKKEKPDILTTQESYNEKDESLPVNFRTLNTLSTALSLPFTHFEPSFYEEIEGREIDRGNLIFSRFPIKERSAKFIFGSYGKIIDLKENFHAHPRNMQRSVIDVNEITLNVYNLQGIYGPHGKDTPERLATFKEVAKEVKDKTNVILCGDFNMQPNTRSIGQITKYLKSVFGNELKSTFNMKRKDDPAYAVASVDMVFISPNIEVLKKETPNVDISDHLPQVVELKLD